MSIHHNPILLIIALVLIALAFVLRLWVGRRRFYRRNWGGREVFSSYKQSIIYIIPENFALFIATVCVIFAIILMAICYWG